MRRGADAPFFCAHKKSPTRWPGDCVMQLWLALRGGRCDRLLSLSLCRAMGEKGDDDA